MPQLFFFYFFNIKWLIRLRANSESVSIVEIVIIWIGRCCCLLQMFLVGCLSPTVTVSLVGFGSCPYSITCTCINTRDTHSRLHFFPSNVREGIRNFCLNLDIKNFCKWVPICNSNVNCCSASEIRRSCPSFLFGLMFLVSLSSGIPQVDFFERLLLYQEPFQFEIWSMQF